MDPRPVSSQDLGRCVVRGGPVHEVVARHPQQVADIVATLSWSVHDPDELRQYLQLCADLTVQVIRGARCAGLTALHLDAPFTAVHAEAARWAGIRSSHTAPIGTPQRNLGALTVHSSSADGVHADDAVLCGMITDHATRALLDHQDRVDAETLAAQLRQAMASRAPIEQAKGILMAAHHVTADEAFALLRTRSQDTNTKLHEVAATFVAELSAGPVPRPRRERPNPNP